MSDFELCQGTPNEKERCIEAVKEDLKDLHLNLDANRVNKLGGFTLESLKKVLLPIGLVIEGHNQIMNKIREASNTRYKEALSKK